MTKLKNDAETGQTAFLVKALPIIVQHTEIME